MEEFPPALDTAGVTGIVRRRIRPNCENEAETIMREILELARQSPGYLGSDIFPPIPGVQPDYIVLYRLDSTEHLKQWLASPGRQELVKRIEPLLADPQSEFFFAHRRRAPGTVSTVFSYRIRPERRADFFAWRHRILEEARTWEGFLGTESFDTLDSDRPEFIVVLRFASRPNLDAWLAAPVRRRFMDEVRRYVEDWQVRRIGTGFEGWFDTSAERRPPAPWRQALMVLAALFPVIMILRHLLLPLFNVLPTPAAFLILLTLDLAVLTWIVMPRFTAWMDFWLRPRPQHTWRSELAGISIIAAIIAGTLAAALALHF